ncbi:HIT family protein [Sediminispirochaeta bajacaliforniensis]|uniref:HIT family protein n=1 Tax=Sediminispirochaeta bajacaliforniensis TaxID=148 RepID=UPI00036A86E3|nr:hypothetical protein [Sediminispirochaeta bajacaliforniensis]
MDTKDVDQCIWCDRDEALEKVVREIASFPTGTLYLHRDQTHRGRCIFAYKEHLRKITELSREQYMALMGDIHTSVLAITKALSPDKVNILILGDTSEHMHIHLCPKYRDGKQWGVPFAVDEAKPLLLDDAALHILVDRMKEYI